MKRAGLLLSLGLISAAAMATQAPVPAQKSTPTAARVVAVPAAHVTDQPNAVLKALKQNDFAGLEQALSVDGDLVEIAKDWDRNAAQHRESVAERAKAHAGTTDQAMQNQYDDTMQDYWLKLQSDAGIDLLVTEFQPKIAEDAGQAIMQFNVGMGASLLAIANDKDLSATEVQQLTQLLYAVQAWTGRVDFADAERLRRALKAVSPLVRQLGLKRFDDVQGMRFEDAMVHGDTLIVAVKQALAVYELDIDAILNSVRLSEVDAFGDQATLRAEARVFGVDIAHNFNMRYYEGKWIDAQSAQSQQQWREQQDQEAAAAAQAAAANAAAGVSETSHVAPGSCAAPAAADAAAKAN